VGYTRRDIVKTLAALPLVRLERAQPDLILYNGRIATMNPAQPEAAAVAIAEGRFLAVGANKDVLALAGKHTRRVDLAGARVFPGFNDAHAHPWNHRRAACARGGHAARRLGAGVSVR
jgi:adenine deaminase